MCVESCRRYCCSHSKLLSLLNFHGFFSIPQLAKALRKGPFQTQLLMGGVDKRVESSKDEASLFWLDYLGTMQKVTSSQLAWLDRLPISHTCMYIDVYIRSRSRRLVLSQVYYVNSIIYKIGGAVAVKFGAEMILVKKPVNGRCTVCT